MISFPGCGISRRRCRPNGLQAKAGSLQECDPGAARSRHCFPAFDLVSRWETSPISHAYFEVCSRHCRKEAGRCGCARIACSMEARDHSSHCQTAGSHGPGGPTSNRREGALDVDGCCGRRRLWDGGSPGSHRRGLSQRLHVLLMKALQLDGESRVKEPVLCHSAYFTWGAK